MPGPVAGLMPGPVEGRVNYIKVIGRAGLPLLRRRVLLTAQN
jgi:transposase